MLSRLAASTRSLLGKIFRPSVSRAIAMSLVAACILHLLMSGGPSPFESTAKAQYLPRQGLIAKAKRPNAPELNRGQDWLNTENGKGLSLKDLHGRIVLLDFWTLCCINCIHIMPDLAALEARYPGVLVVIGVHSAKFENEKDTNSIRKAILRYEIKHPVVNDADHKLWNAFGVQSWPSFAIIDPDGKFAGYTTSEGQLETLDKAIKQLIKEYKGKGLKETPFDIKLVKEREPTPLYFPGKVLTDAASKRIFIADSTDHRIVITDLEGKKIAIAGSGKEGFKDGKFSEARFSDPQGMALDGDTLYVADRKNHCIRALDLKAETVKIVAGTGEQEHNFEFRDFKTHVAGTTRLNSPWDLLMVNKKIFIAMAGHHQIWIFDPALKRVAPYAGKGDENVRDGDLHSCAFAQPSGLTTDGKFLYVADSESSSVRSIPLPGVSGEVTTVVGVSGPDELFNFGDKDGVGREVRLQHCLGVACYDGKVYVADTYNSKIKVIDPATRKCDTWLGDPPGWLKAKMFFEPGGVCIAGGVMYVADTNNHRIQIVDMNTKEAVTLRLQGVDPVQRETLASKN